MNENISVKPNCLTANKAPQSELQSFIEKYENQVMDVLNISKRIYFILGKLRGAVPLVQNDDAPELRNDCILSSFDQVRVKLNSEINNIYNQLDELEKII